MLIGPVDRCQFGRGRFGRAVRMAELLHRFSLDPSYGQATTRTWIIP